MLDKLKSLKFCRLTLRINNSAAMESSLRETSL